MDIPIIDLGEETLLRINENNDDKKQVHSYILLCNACLCVGRTLHEITDEKLARYYLEAVREIPLCNTPTKCPKMCWECKAYLRKAANFKEQVQNSYRILQTYASENLHEYLLSDIVRSSHLQTCVKSPISVAPVIQTVEDSEPSERVMYMKEELKIEWEGKEANVVSSPLNNDGPPSDCDAADLDTATPTLSGRKKKKRTSKELKSKAKRAEKVVKKLRNGMKKPKRPKPTTDQKIITLELSYEEMLSDREKEANKESYLRARFRCESCLLAFSCRRARQAHMDAKHAKGLGDYICPICKTIISSVESFTSHYKRHMRRYECSICHKRTLDIKVMQQHYYSTHEIALKEYKCDLCGKISNSIDTHRYHKDTHKARVQCSECDKTFTHRAGLLNHRLSVHELHNAFPCTVCDKVFRWKTSLKRHLEKHDDKDKCGPAAAYCAECGVTFSSVSSYQRHMKNSLKHVTQDQLRFICDHCNRRFADKTKLRDHIEEKHLHKTYQCHICLKPSKNRVALDQHVRNVHRGRPHNKICHHCGKAFPTKVQLESHIRTHTGERPYICEYCPTTFSQQSNLYKHNRQVHLNIKSKRYPMCKKGRDEKQPEAPPEALPEPYRPVAVLHYSPERGLIM